MPHKGRGREANETARGGAQKLDTRKVKEMPPETQRRAFRSKEKPECDGVLVAWECSGDSTSVFMALAAATAYHTLGVCNSGSSFSHRSQGWESKVKVLSGLVWGGTCLPHLQMAPFSCPLAAFPLCSWGRREISVSLPLLIRTPVLLYGGLTLTTSFNLIYFLTTSPNTSQWG